MRPRSTRHDRGGFTLVELGVVILIIGLMMSFLLVASWEGLRRGEERATQALILKIDTALSDRIEALTQQRPPANLAHRYLSMTEIPGSPNRYLESVERARLIAKIDYLRRELPDVFFVQPDAFYPLNFAGMAFHPETANPIGSSGPSGGFPANYAPYVLPLGHALQSPGAIDPESGLFVPAAGPTFWRAGGGVRGLAGEGIFGASYSAIGALTRQLGYPERGYNGTDDDGNGLIDERTASEFGMDSGAFATLNAEINDRLGRHRHITARSEMLYAILVGGAGPLGSVFSPDDFSDREVRDTDGDGLLEFVDAWGRPLQFYRWPTYYTTDFGSPRSFQKGSAAYDGRTETREQNTLDPNQLLVSPSWWVNLANLTNDSSQMSDRANLFQQHFFSLVDPRADVPSAGPAGLLWDRSGFYKRRAYFSKALIASSGPDRQLGIGSFGLTYGTSSQSDRLPQAMPTDSFAARMVIIEGQADRSNPFDRAVPANAGNAGSLTIDDAGQAGRMGLYQLPPNTAASPTTEFIRSQWGLDDITNQTINAPGTGVR